jgi:hypothetical protein
MPDSPPRVGEEIPCTWRVHNLAAHRVALALAPPHATIVSGDVAAASAPTAQAHPAAASSSPTGSASAGKTAHDAKPKPGTKGSAAHGSPDHAAPTTAPAAEVKTPAPAPIEPEALAGTIVDLAPGETMQRPIFIGPVQSAGHYEVRVACDDLGVRFRPSAFPPGLPPLQAAIPMRFEQ